MKTQILKNILMAILIMTGGLVQASDLTFEVSGWVKKDNKAFRRALVKVYDGETLIIEQRTDRIGNFNISLDVNKEYLITVQGDEIAEKKIVVNTQLGNNKVKSEYIFFEFVVDVWEINHPKNDDYLNHYVAFDHRINDFRYQMALLSDSYRSRNDTNATQLISEQQK